MPKLVKDEQKRLNRWVRQEHQRLAAQMVTKPEAARQATAELGMTVTPGNITAAYDWEDIEWHNARGIGNGKEMELKAMLLVVAREVKQIYERNGNAELFGEPGPELEQMIHQLEAEAANDDED